MLYGTLGWVAVMLRHSVNHSSAVCLLTSCEQVCAVCGLTFELRHHSGGYGTLKLTGHVARFALIATLPSEQIMIAPRWRMFLVCWHNECINICSCRVRSESTHGIREGLHRSDAWFCVPEPLAQQMLVCRSALFTNQRFTNNDMASRYCLFCFLPFMWPPSNLALRTACGNP
jgi:hypothetical protein